MSQFDKRSKMDELQMTSLATLVPYGDHTNLKLQCRVVWVQGNVNPTKKSRVPGVFSVVVAAKDGIADLSVWEPDTLPHWQKMTGAMVVISGMSCSKHKPASLDFARAPGEWGLNVNKERYELTVLKGYDDATFPKNGTVPAAWLRRATTPPQSARDNSDYPSACCTAPYLREGGERRPLRVESGRENGRTFLLQRSRVFFFGD